MIFVLILLAACSKEECPCDDLSAVHKFPPEDNKMHLCAFHLAKDDLSFIVETQHYCCPLRPDLFQCILYETTAEGVRPKLLGIEYVIPDSVYQTLDAKEKEFWHPHDFEVREGLLVTIGMSECCDQKTMKTLVNTWGKVWHTWPDPSTHLPLGYPRLMWSAIKEGEIPEELVKKRDARWGTDTAELKKKRAQYLPPESSP